MKLHAVILLLLLSACQHRVATAEAVTCKIDHAVPASARSIEHLVDIMPQVATLTQRYGAERVLAVFDIDNTLLTMGQALGSDGWYRWQDCLLQAKADAKTSSPDLVAADYPGLFEISRLLYALSDMRPTEPGTAGLIASLADLGIPSLALTARGPDNRDATLRALKRAGIRLGDPVCGAPLCAARGVLSADQVATAVKAVTGDDFKGRPASFSNGVMMVSGQDKGVMLRLLLASLEPRYQAVIFVDDTPANVRAVVRAKPDIAAELEVFHYRAYQPAVDRFLVPGFDGRALGQQWRELRAGFCGSAQAGWCCISGSDQFPRPAYCPKEP